MAGKKSGADGRAAADELGLLFERVERLKEEQKAIGEDIKDVFNEAKSRGFDVATMKDVLKLRKMTPDDRKHKLAMVELYLVATGMGDGSLSDMAREFLEQRNNPAPSADADTAVDQDVPEFDPSKTAAGAGDAEAAAPDAPKPLTVDDAKRLGADAQKRGKPVTANPFPARDPRRAAWDEAWCQAGGSDGMEIPEVLMSDKALEEKRKKEAERARDDAAAAAKVAGSVEALFEQAKADVIRSQSGSTSALQQSLKISHAEAAALMEALEAAGVVSAPNLRGMRDVLEPKPDGEE